MVFGDDSDTIVHKPVVRYNINDVPPSKHGSLSPLDGRRKKPKRDSDEQVLIQIYKKNPGITRGKAFELSGFTKNKFNSIHASPTFKDALRLIQEEVQAKEDQEILNVFDSCQKRLLEIIEDKEEHTANVLSAMKLLTTTKFFTDKHEDAIARKGGKDDSNKTTEVRESIKKLAFLKRAKELEIELKGKNGDSSDLGYDEGYSDENEDN